ncbi:hypothetical protein ACFLYR_01105 [Chloroflexota bacterium]
MEDKEQKNVDDLWREFLDTINKQLELNTELKDIVENSTKASSQKKASDLTEERVDKIRDLSIEMESSLGEERAIYHSLFGIED